MIQYVDEKEALFVTHAGTFHADDLMATVLLENLYPDRVLKLARVNDVPDDHDVFAYDIGMGTYDHHQPDKAIRDNGIHYSSVGLIWRDYGNEILMNLGFEEDVIDDLWYEIDDFLMLPIDAIDNGEGRRIPFSVSSVLQDHNPCFNDDTSYDEAFLNALKLAHIIFNVVVKSLSDDIINGNQLDIDDGYEMIDELMRNVILDLAEQSGCFIYDDEGDARELWEAYGKDIVKHYGGKEDNLLSSSVKLEKAMIYPMYYDRPVTKTVMGIPFEIILIMLDQYSDESTHDLLLMAYEHLILDEVGRASAKDYVDECILKSKDHILLLEKFAPWRALVLQSDKDAAAAIYITVFPSLRAGWNWQSVPLTTAKEDETIEVPDAWKGKRDQELADICGVSDAVFCHPDGFIGGAKSKEGAIQMAKLAIDYYLKQHPELEEFTLTRTK